MSVYPEVEAMLGPLRLEEELLRGNMKRVIEDAHAAFRARKRHEY